MFELMFGLGLDFLQEVYAIIWSDTMFRIWSGWFRFNQLSIIFVTKTHIYICRKWTW